MYYKITRQYKKSEEKLIAAFRELDDARIFITRKISDDELERKKIIYRIYDDFELLLVFNEEALSSDYLEDAEKYGQYQFPFSVKVKIANTLEQDTIACFNDKEDATIFIISKCSAYPDSDLFFIFKDKVLIDTLNKNIIDTRTRRAERATGSEKGTTARLTPLSSRPTPPGGPKDYWVEDDREDANET